MNPKAGLIILFVILGIVPNTNRTYSSADFGECTISSIDITYRFVFSPEQYDYYEDHRTIKLRNGAYYYSEHVIDSELIQGLLESLTDFYESSQREECHEEPSFSEYLFTIIIHFSNGEDMVLESVSQCYCWIPWNIVYDGKMYVQYNGKIPSALFKIFEEFNDLRWSVLAGWERSGWECYPVIPPEKFQNQVISSDFPRSDVVITPEEIRGRKHMLWMYNVADYITGRPVLSDGRIFVTTYSRLISFSRNGKKLWELSFREKKQKLETCSWCANNIVAHEGIVYAAGSDFWVYSVDFVTGDVLWEYDLTYVEGYKVSLHVFRDYLLIFTRGITCLDRKTGEKVWEISPDIYGQRVYDDKIVFKYWAMSYGLVDILSGEIIWEEDSDEISNLVYDDGILYFYRWDERALVSSDLQGNEIWSLKYPHGIEFTVFEEILLFVCGAENFYLEKVILLDKKGSTLWEYVPEENISWRCRDHLSILKDEIFLHCGEFVISLDRETGEISWMTKVREGTETFQYYRDKIYLFAENGILYCLSETGRLLWKLDTGVKTGGLVLWGYEEHACISEIEDNLVVITTSDGKVYAVSPLVLYWSDVKGDHVLQRF